MPTPPARHGSAPSPAGDSLSPRECIVDTIAAVWAWDIATDTFSPGEGWRDILAVPHGVYIGTTLGTFLSLVGDTDRDMLRGRFAAIAEGSENALDLAVRMRRFDGTWIWVLLRGTCRAGSGRTGTVTGIGLEVSGLRYDNRFAPPFSGDAQSLFHSLVAHSPNSTMRFDRDCLPIYMNPAALAWLSSSGVPTNGRHLASSLPEADAEFFQTNVARVFASGKEVKARRVIETLRGSMVGDFVFWPERDSDGRVLSVVSVQRDITAEVLREKEAQAGEKRLAALYRLTQMHDVSEEEVNRFVVETIADLTDSPYSHLHLLPGSADLEGHIVWSSSHMFLFSQKELDTPSPALIMGEFGCDPEVDAEPVATECWNQAVTNASRKFFKDKLSVTRYLCVPALENGKPMCVAVVYNKKTDYTPTDMRQLETFISGAWLVLRRRRSVVELKKAKESAERATKVKDRFLANVSHELRTPLNGMLGMLQLLEFSSLSPEQREYAKSATTTGRTLLRIISDILDYTKMESGRLELECAPFDLKECLVSTVSLFKADTQEKNLNLNFSLTGEFPPLVDGDEARVRQIMFNLVGNSLKFTEKGEIEVVCEARRTRADFVTVHLSVRDTGIGIPEHMQSRIFEAFTQVDGSSTRRHQGSGLGLGIVRELTRIMGGAITLRSTPGRGTIVECALPFALPSAEAATAHTLSNGLDASMPYCPSLDILAVEDDDVSRLAMKLFLEKLGHRVVCVCNGREALEALRLYPFHCLVSDVLMPEMDGLEMARHIREGLADTIIPSAAVRDAIRAVIPHERIPQTPISVPPDVPIIAVSAHAMKGDREEFLAKGMDYYLSKPVKIKDLGDTLRKVCADGTKTGK